MLYTEMVAGLETFGLDEQQTIVNALEEVAEGVGKGCAAQRRADDNSKRTVGNDRPGRGSRIVTGGDGEGKVSVNEKLSARDYTKLHM